MMKFFTKLIYRVIQRLGQVLQAIQERINKRWPQGLIGSLKKHFYHPGEKSWQAMLQHTRKSLDVARKEHNRNKSISSRILKKIKLEHWSLERELKLEGVKQALGSYDVVNGSELSQAILPKPVHFGPLFIHANVERFRGQRHQVTCSDMAEEMMEKLNKQLGVDFHVSAITLRENSHSLSSLPKALIGNVRFMVTAGDPENRLMVNRYLSYIQQAQAATDG